MCLKAITTYENTTQFQLEKVNWKRINTSPILYSYDLPAHDCFTEVSMCYYYLHDDIQSWFNEQNAKAKVLWCYERKAWFLDIFDKSIAVLFKLTWHDSIYFT